MLEAKKVPPNTADSFWRPERKAWAVMLSAFAVFCLIGSFVLTSFYRFAFESKPWTLATQVVQPDAAALLRSGFTRAEMLVDGSNLHVGDEIRVSATMRAGIAVRLLTDGAVIGLWPATNVLVEQNAGGNLRLRVESGQAVIELPKEGRSLFVTGQHLAQEFELTAPGRYRIRELDDMSTITARAEYSAIPSIEVATDSGLARMGDVAIGPGRRVLGSASWQQLDNQWELVRDGSFQMFSEDDYRATLSKRTDIPKSDTWSVTQQAQSVGVDPKNGLFHLLKKCDEQNNCRNIVRLARLGGNDKDSITAIKQDIDADVASYQSVRLDADVRIDQQSLSKGGADGSECPLFARVVYTNNSQTNLEQNFCFWAIDRGSGAISNQPYILSQQIPPNTWYHFSTDLRTVIPDLRLVQRVVFYSNGHDYDASIADISMRASGLIPALQP